MNIQQWIDERSDEELPAVLSGVVRRLVSNQVNGDDSYPLRDERGETIGYFTPADDDDDAELIAEAMRREQINSPCVSVEEAEAAIKWE